MLDGHCLVIGVEEVKSAAPARADSALMGRSGLNPGLSYFRVGMVTLALFDANCLHQTHFRLGDSEGIHPP